MLGSVKHGRIVGYRAVKRSRSRTGLPWRTRFGTWQLSPHALILAEVPARNGAWHYSNTWSILVAYRANASREVGLVARGCRRTDPPIRYVGLAGGVPLWVSAVLASCNRPAGTRASRGGNVGGGARFPEVVACPALDALPRHPCLWSTVAIL